MTKKILTLIGSILITLIIIAASFFMFRFVRAEQSGGSPNNDPAVSHLTTIYNSLEALRHGSVAAGGWGDWGAYLNRIQSAVNLLPSGCPAQQWHDSLGTEANNCSLPWTDAAIPIVGQDDNRSAPLGGQDPRTGLIWSQYLRNNAGAVEFAASGGSSWNWDGTLKFTVAAATAAVGDTYTNNGQTFTVAYAIAGATTLYAKPASSGLPAASGELTRVTGSGTNPINFSVYTLYGSNVAVGSKTAKELCSERGNGWRLPTQKELMQAYIDGSFWNLTNPAYPFWSFTEYDATNAWYVTLSNGYTNSYLKAAVAYYVRCVR